MREIFSVRFFAAVGAVAGLFVVLIAVQSSRNGIDSGSSEPAAAVRRIDLVEPVESSTNPAFTVVDGVAATETELVLDERRRVRVVPGTPGVISCDPAGRDRCAIVADLLGEAVVWFALVPAGRGPAVELPAIDTIDDGIATLVNGWQVPHAPVLDRRCRDAGGRDVEFASYREFRERLDDRFVSFYDTTDRRLVAVECL